MTHFREFLERIDAAGELLRVRKPVNPRFELAALLKQAEQRRKAIWFESAGATIPVVGGLLTSPARMALGLGRDDAATFTQAQHAELIREAIKQPLASVQVDSAPCQELVLTGSDVDCAVLPVPTFFADDSGPFLTAAVGISRNPDNGVLNVGIYRVLMTGRQQVAVSASPASNLFRFMKVAASRSEPLPVALLIGPDPAVLMAAAAKPAGDISELDVAGALNNKPLDLVTAITSDLLVPAHAEIVLEVSVSPDEQILNTMGEFGDFYGDQNAPLATVDAITRREDAIFHTIMAGAGSEHNNIGYIILYEIEAQLFKQLKDRHPEIAALRVYFEPPRLGMMGEVYLQLAEGAEVDVRALIHDCFTTKCGEFDIARIIRRVIVVHDDIDIRSRREVDWAVATRANTAAQVLLTEDLPASAGKLRIGINACANPDERRALRRLKVPGADRIDLDDYLT